MFDACTRNIFKAWKVLLTFKIILLYRCISHSSFDNLIIRNTACSGILEEIEELL